MGYLGHVALLCAPNPPYPSLSKLSSKLFFFSKTKQKTHLFFTLCKISFKKASSFNEFKASFFFFFFLRPVSDFSRNTVSNKTAGPNVQGAREGEGDCSRLHSEGVCDLQ